MDDFKARKIRQQGRKAFQETGGKGRNPFEPGSEEFNLFERGWTQALRLHRGPLPGEAGTYSAPQPGRGSLADKYRNMRDWSSKDEDDR